jgi:hypothetical protein
MAIRLTSARFPRDGQRFGVLSVRRTPRSTLPYLAAAKRANQCDLSVTFRRAIRSILETIEGYSFESGVTL